MTSSDILSFGEKLRILIEHAHTPDQQVITIEEFIRRSAISQQNVFNLLNGKVTDPRLKTLLQIGSVYASSMDYFSCQTRSDCVNYLVEHGHLDETRLKSIYDTSERLSNRSRKSVLSLFNILQRGKTDQ